MDHLNIYESSSYSSSDSNHDNNNKVEPGELLEDCWFFGNLLDTKTRKMSRSFSDPCSSSNFSLPGKSHEETYESIKKLPKGFVGPSLVKTPSLPPRIERKDRKPTMKGSFSDPPKSTKTTSSNNLLRAPSLPSSLGAEQESDHDDEEIEFSMGKLIRQASLNSKSNSTLPPRTLVPKVATQNSIISRTGSKKKPEVQWSKPDNSEKVRPQRFANRLKPQKSFNDVESRELQGFKDLGFDFEKMDLNPIVTSPISSFQEKQGIEENEEKNTTTPPYLPSAPPVPNWGGKRSSEDVKAQIRFWARAVASNVRQEC